LRLNHLVHHRRDVGVLNARVSGKGALRGDGAGYANPASVSGSAATNGSRTGAIADGVGCGTSVIVSVRGGIHLGADVSVAH
jgi:hypothetical protein